jgi:hypothetical protein
VAAIELWSNQVSQLHACLCEPTLLHLSLQTLLSQVSQLESDDDGRVSQILHIAHMNIYLSHPKILKF